MPHRSDPADHGDDPTGDDEHDVVVDDDDGPAERNRAARAVRCCLALSRQRVQSGHRVALPDVQRLELEVRAGAARLRRPDGHHGGLRPKRLAEVRHEYPRDSCEAGASPR